MKCYLTRKMDGQIYFLCKMYCYFENSSLDVKYHWTKYLPIDTDQARYSLSEKDAQDVKNQIEKKRPYLNIQIVHKDNVVGLMKQ